MPASARKQRPARGAVEMFGQYVLHESLGHGGMATVRRAELRGAAGFRRIVALKQLHPHLTDSPEILSLFAREARLGSYLRHTNIAHTFDFGSVDGVYYIAMELIRGPTLAQLARQCASAAGPIPMAIVMGILTQLCDAFDYIHRASDPKGRPLQLVHCDVSPSNIIIANTGVVKLIDFGIARAASAQFRAETGMLRSRLAYVAPEYQEGKPDVRSDLFSLGVIGYELIANQPLFAGGGDELRRVREMPIPALSRGRAGSVPHALQDVIMTALQRDVGKRWQTAAEMRAALAEVAKGMAVHVGPPQVAAWIEWAYAQRMRPGGPTPLVVMASAAAAPVPVLSDEASGPTALNVAAAGRERVPAASPEQSTPVVTPASARDAAPDEDDEDDDDDIDPPGHAAQRSTRDRAESVWGADAPTKLRRGGQLAHGMYLLRRARPRVPRMAQQPPRPPASQQPQEPPPLPASRPPQLTPPFAHVATTRYQKSSAQRWWATTASGFGRGSGRPALAHTVSRGSHRSERADRSGRGLLGDGTPAAKRAAPAPEPAVPKPSRVAARAAFAAPAAEPVAPKRSQARAAAASPIEPLPSAVPTRPRARRGEAAIEPAPSGSGSRSRPVAEPPAAPARTSARMPASPTSAPAAMPARTSARMPASGAAAAPSRAPVAAAPPRRPGETTGIVVVPAPASGRRAPSAEPARGARPAASAKAPARMQPLAELIAMVKARPMNALIAGAALLVLVLGYLVIRH